MTHFRAYARPNRNWKIGDDPRTWPHGFVGYHGGKQCGVIIDNDSDPDFGPAVRCMRAETNAIHHIEVNE